MPGKIHDDYDALYVPQLDYITGDLDGDGRVESIILDCYPELVALFRASFPMVRQVISRGTSMPLFDCRAHLMSLGKILGIDEKKLVSTPTPYLTTPAKRINPWAEKIAGDDALQVGIAWKGRDAYFEDHLRSLPFAALTLIFQVPRVQFHIIQPDKQARRRNRIPARGR